MKSKWLALYSLLATACVSVPEPPAEVDPVRASTADAGVAPPQDPTATSVPYGAAIPDAVVEPIDPAATIPIAPIPTVPFARCDRSKPFTAPKPAFRPDLLPGPVVARLSPDELTLYLKPVAMAASDVFVARRPTINADWDPPSRIAEVSSVGNDGAPTVTADGLRMYLHSNRDGDFDIWVSRRASAADPWSPPRAASLSGPQRDVDPFVRADGRMILFSSNRAVANGGAPGHDLYKAYVDERGAPGAATRIEELTTDADETSPVITPDGLAIYFSRRGASQDVWTAHRTSLTERFGTPVRLAVIATDADERPTWVSADDCFLWLARGAGGDTRMYVAARPI
jgi:hypothetical protein